MKKIFTLIAATVLSLSLFALGPQTKLTVSTNSKKNVTIVVDGRTYNDRQADDEVVIKNLAAGAHNIKVYEQNSNGWYNRRMMQQMLYNGDVYIKPNYHTTLSINRNGRAVISEKAMSYWDYPSNGQEGGYNYQYRQVMNDRSFDQFRYTINRTSFENSKIGVAKEVISQNYFTADQIKTLLGSFNYESSKVEVAKSAYDRVVDKENFYTVLDAFTYNSSKDEMLDFMRNARR